jgi:hypothetical protein
MPLYNERTSVEKMIGNTLKASPSPTDERKTAILDDPASVPDA